jgi:hypothetical protein
MYAQRFRTKCAAIPQCMRSDSARNAQRFRSECAPIAHEKRSDSAAIP